MASPEHAQDAPVSSPTATPTPSPGPSPVPPPVPVETHPNRGAFKQSRPAVPVTARLAPNDVYKTVSPPRLKPLTEIHGSAAAAAAAAALRPAVASLRAPPAIPPVAARLAEERRRNASRRRRPPRVWKKLLWIKQHGFPDNYTDTETFLDHLQLNPKLRPYEFWPLVADSTVIVQHVCSVTIFVSAYAGIYQDRLSPTTVVAWGTAMTVLGWFLWDGWTGQRDARRNGVSATKVSYDKDEASSRSSGDLSLPVPSNGNANGHAYVKPNSGIYGPSVSTTSLVSQLGETKGHGHSLSNPSIQSISPIESPQAEAAEPFPSLQPMASRTLPSPAVPISSTTLPQTISPRNQARLKTFKSALLIYFALLGLSPILKSLTKSTSSDSIWALATWLLIINIFFFDYRSLTPSKGSKDTQSPPLIRSQTDPDGLPIPPDAASVSSSNIPSPVRAPPFPSSLSTNAALMASTVLASRLPSTSSVFSLTLFSIQVFGLFPVFRRHLRSVSLPLHVLLTMALILLSTASLNLILSQSYTHTYGDCGYCWAWLWHVTSRGILGMILFGGTTVFIMGACSWWLIGLQRYKNVVIGPWDPAKPVLAGGYGRRGTDA
jgi:phosphatidylinositol N-acetylglucosaminyltransferase subunit C